MSPRRPPSDEPPAEGPVCSFCGDRPVAVWFEGPDFRTAVSAAEKVRADEAWLACMPCFSLVGADDRDELTLRVTKQRVHRGTTASFGQVQLELDARFWKRRDDA